MKVQDVCIAGNAEACKRVKFTEDGGFVGGIAGGVAVGSALTVSSAGAICIGLGVPTGLVGWVVCGIVVVAAGSFGGGVLGGMAGEEIGDMIYESVQ